MTDLRSEPLSPNISRYRVFAVEKNHDISGLLVNDQYGFCIGFSGVRQMLSRLDGLFDYVNFPMAATERRTFGEENNRLTRQGGLPAYVKPATDETSEREGTEFVLHVQFRQGSTWQGTLSRADSREIRRFRSEFELITLMLDAMGFSAGESGDL